MTVQSFWMLLTHFPLAALSHALLSRWLGDRMARQKTAVVAVIVAALGTVTVIATLEFFGNGGDRGLHWSGICFSLVNVFCISHIYFHFFNMSETARRIRLLIQLKRGESLNDGSYSARELIEIRIQRLLELNQWRLDGDWVRPKNTLLTWVARLMISYRKMLFRT